jgi:GxxExxY protein
MSILHKEITDAIINSFYTVYNSLGHGFLEKVYENAMVHELIKRGLNVATQVPIKVYYDGQLVGEYFADLLVEKQVIIELKASENLCLEHEAQLLNYLKSTHIEIGLLLNFGSEPKFKRKIFTNNRKKLKQS